MNIYHDESQGEGWFAIGLLWVDPEDAATIVSDLISVRRRTEYWNEIHFADLSDYAPKRDTARDWVRLATRRHCARCWFNILAVDTTNPKYQGRRFDEDWQMYNRFTGMALWSGYRRFKLGPLDIDYVSDAKDRTPSDNFEEYLEYRFWKDQALVGDVLSRKAFGYSLQLAKSRVRVRTVQVRDNRSEGTADTDEELLQLCDLILGASCQTLTAASTSPSRTIKPELARKMMKVYRPLYGHEWFHHFTISCFPDDTGGFYSTPPFKLDVKPGRQTRLGEGL